MKELSIGSEALRRLGEYKQPPQSAFRIGELVQEQLHGPAIRQAQLLGEICSALEPLLDDADRPHCRVLRCDRGRLTVQVDNPALVPEFRKKYVFALRDGLKQALPQGRIREIKFTALG